MTLRPPIFISAVSKELGSARQLVAHTLQLLGYEPVFQEVFGVNEGLLLAMLRKKVDQSKGVVQIVGHCYGAEPPAPDVRFGRVSYTQYEALYARQRGKKVWVLVLDDTFATDPHEAEPEKLRSLQASYRQRLLQTDPNMFHPLNSSAELKASILMMKDELARLRRNSLLWAAAMTALLVAILALVVRVLLAVTEPPPPEAMTEPRAYAAFVAKNYADAFAAYLQLSDSAPANISYHRRVEECARLGRLQKPFLDRYRVLVQRQPDNALYHNYLGNAYLLLDPRDSDGQAKEHYESALRIDPQFNLPFANLGILAYRSGRTDDALSHFQRYLAAYPEDAQGWVNLGMLYAAKFSVNTSDLRLVQQAEHAFRKALGIEPGLADAHKGLGRVFAAGGRKTDALAAYQRSLTLNYDQPEVRQQVELLAWEFAGSLTPALQSDDLKTRSVKGDVALAPLVVTALRCLDQQRFQEAAQACLEWCKREPDNPLACGLLARAYDGQGLPEAAQKARDEASRLSAKPSLSP